MTTMQGVDMGQALVAIASGYGLFLALIIGVVILAAFIALVQYWRDR